MVLPYYGNGALFMMFLRQGGLCNLLLPIYFLFYSGQGGLCNLLLPVYFLFYSGPVLALGLAREDAISGWRNMLGPTEVEKAKTEAPER